jgi:DNA-binding NarL/FixJ family response regulator
MNSNERTATSEIKIIIADDHPLVRHGLRQASNSKAGFASSPKRATGNLRSV